MKFVATALPGALIVELEPQQDERGHFARTFCRDEFRRRGLRSEFVQCSVSLSRRRGTLRGMHYQTAPHEEAKLVRCTRGRMLDVIVDLRPDSPGFRRWLAVELSAGNGRMLYVPEAFAHGFLTLEDETEVFYQISQAFHPESTRGFRWDDLEIGIAWPEPPALISERDRALPSFAAAREAR